MWLLTVAGLMRRCPAISALARPVAISVRTSCSRLVVPARSRAIARVEDDELRPAQVQRAG